MSNVNKALCLIFVIGIVAGIPHGPDGRGPPEFIKKCMEENGFEPSNNGNGEVTEAEACFSECVTQNRPKEMSLEEMENRCKETGDCHWYEHAKKMQECFENTQPSTEKCAEGSRMAQCFHQLHPHGPPPSA